MVETQIAARVGRLIDGEMFRAYLSTELPCVVAGDECKSIGEHEGGLPFDCRQKKGAPEVRCIAERHLRQAAIIRACGIRDTWKSDGGRDVLVVILLISTGPDLVGAKADFIHLPQ